MHASMPPTLPYLRRSALGQRGNVPKEERGEEENIQKYNEN
jgi:hypothetical protein